MSEPRKTTMSPSPQAESGPEPGADSGQAQATLAPSLDDEAFVSQSDEVPESADVPDDQDQHSEDEESRYCKAHRDAEEHHNAYTRLYIHTQNMLAGPDREHLPREVINDRQDLHLLRIGYRELWLKAYGLKRFKKELDKDEAEMKAMLARLVERRVEFAKEKEEYRKKKQSLDIESDGIRDRFAALGTVGNVNFSEIFR